MMSEKEYCDSLSAMSNKNMNISEQIDNLQCMVYQGRYKAVLKKLEQRDDLFKYDQSRMQEIKAMALYHENEFSEACSVFKKLISGSYDIHSALYLAKCERKLGNTDEAVSVLFNAVEFYRDNHNIESESAVIGYLEDDLYQELIELSLSTDNFDKISDYLVSRISNNYGSVELFENIMEALYENDKLKEYNKLKKKYCDKNTYLCIKLY